MEGQQAGGTRVRMEEAEVYVTQGWDAREGNLDFLLCVMVSLECFQQGSDPNWIL